MAQRRIHGDIVGIILAGGASTRMGAEKALLPLAGRPMLAHVVERLAPQVSRLVVSANGDPQRFAAFALPVVADVVSGGQGPLAGLHAGMLWAADNVPAARAVVTVPADVPFIPDDLVDRLSASRAEVALAASASGVHPAVGLWATSIAAALGAYLSSGADPKVSAFAEGYGPERIYFPSRPLPEGAALDPFFNVNRPADAATAERLAAAINC